MGNFQTTLETRKRTFISVCSVCMAVTLKVRTTKWEKSPCKLIFSVLGIVLLFPTIK